MEKTWFLPGLFLMEKTGGRDGLAGQKNFHKFKKTTCIYRIIVVKY